MKAFLILTVCLSIPLPDCDAGDKAIHSLVAALNHRPTKNVFPWDEGMRPIVKAPARVTPSQVVARCLPMWGSTESIKHYKILAVEERLLIPSSFSDHTRYPAVLIRSGQTKKIILMRYTGNDWSATLFDVEDGHFRSGERVWP